MELELKQDQSELFLGRLDTCDVVLSEETVSRKHARVVKENGEWLIEDLHSKHGTKLNNESLVPSEKKIIRNGDEIRIGQQVLTVKIDAARAAQNEHSEPYYFVYLNGPNSGRKIILDPKKSELTLGRSSKSDILLNDKNVSRKHAKLRQDVDGVWLEDWNSKNGSFVNDSRLSEPVLLKDSDQIHLGDLKLEFVDSNAAMLKRLSVLPAFQEPEAGESKIETSPPPQAASQVPLPPPVKSSPWIDYVYISLMGLVVLGLVVGAVLWLKG